MFYFYIPGDEEGFQRLLEREINIKFFIIKKYNTNNETYFIMCFDHLLLIANQTHLPKLSMFFKKNHFIKASFIIKNNVDYTDCDALISQFISYDFLESLKFTNFNKSKIEIMNKEIANFSEQLCIEITKNASINTKNKIYTFWTKVRKSISAFLIKKAYKKLSFDRLAKWKELSNGNTNKIQMKQKEYTLCISESFLEIIYYIKEEQIFLVKLFCESDMNLYEREKNNYEEMHYPFLPLYYGPIEIDFMKGLIIEYIKGKTLDEIMKTNPNFELKVKIFFEILLVIKYLHEKDFVYRDLKPNNIIIDKNKTVVLIDFDRMIKINSKSSSEITKDFSHKFIAPEIILGHSYSFKSDVYSIGMIMNDMFENNLVEESCLEEDENSNYFIKICTVENFRKRMTLSDLLKYFTYNNFNILFDTYKRNKDFILPIFNDLIGQFVSFELAMYYNQEPSERNASLYLRHLLDSAERGHHPSEYLVGYTYYTGYFVAKDYEKAKQYFLRSNVYDEYITGYSYLGHIYYIEKNFEKAMFYLSFAANQNDSFAQYCLGIIYADDEYIQKDYEKAVHFLTLSANQGYNDALICLGKIYLYGKFNIVPDINKSIHYLQLITEEDDPEHYSLLGLIYLNYNDDINKAIYYLSLAANLNDLRAQHFLGLVYLFSKYVQRDVNKAIHYLVLAANNNCLEAQNDLGFFYLDEELCSIDINKGIYYFTLAANQNHSESQFNLGMIYSKGKFIPRDIYKAIHYFTLAANQNHQDAQYELAVIYYSNIYILQEKYKAIHYFTLAANQNQKSALFYLGLIYIQDETYQNINLGIDYLVKSSNQNGDYAQVLLGLLYLEGIFVNQDYDKGVYYLTLASYQKNPIS